MNEHKYGLDQSWTLWICGFEEADMDPRQGFPETYEMI